MKQKIQARNKKYLEATSGKKIPYYKRGRTAQAHIEKILQHSESWTILSSICQIKERYNGHLGANWFAKCSNSFTSLYSLENDEIWLKHLNKNLMQ